MEASKRAFMSGFGLMQDVDGFRAIVESTRYELDEDVRKPEYVFRTHAAAMPDSRDEN